MHLFIIFPATEEIHSEGKDVAGMQKSFLAKAESAENYSSFFLHHSNGLE